MAGKRVGIGLGYRTIQSMNVVELVDVDDDGGPARRAACGKVVVAHCRYAD
jgi:hypothetical protein